MKLISIFRHGINNDDIGPIAKASFEETPEMFLKAARHGELDHMRGVSSNVMCGQEGYYGTSFQVILDIDKMKTLEAAEELEKDEKEELDEMFKLLENKETKCKDKLKNRRKNIVTKASIGGDVDDDYMPSF